jgi:ABC-2 type transport system ATP-binding protein
MAAPVIRADHLSKDYGRDRGVTDLTFEVEEGEVFGYLGPNGAGKTTTIRLMLDLIRPSGGRIELFGLDARRRGPEARRGVGYLPGDLRLYESLTAREHLRYFASLRGMPDLGDGERLATRLELELDRPIRALSKGNRQKVGLVQALMHRPALSVFDEPTAGLDPLVQQSFFELLRETVAEGRTAFLSSHILGEVEKTCDRVAIIREGRLVKVDRVEALRDLAHHQIELSFAQPVPAVEFALLPGVSDVVAQDHVLRMRVTGSVAPVVQAAARHNLLDLVSREPSLEETFLAQYGREAVEVNNHGR